MKSKSDVYGSKFLVTIYGSCGLLMMVAKVGELKVDK